MHGCRSGSALLVNAEVDSMGGIVDGRVGIGLKTSSHRVAIEKAQAELRQEYDVREERRRELEFLEKGGNPLDFKFGNAASVSVQSTSLTDQNPEDLVTSEPKGSSALAALPHGGSVESIGKLGAPTGSEPNIADSLTLFDGDNDLPEGERKSLHFTRRINIAISEQSSQVDGTHNAKEPEDSAVVRPYARRNRSRISHESSRSNSFDIAQSCDIQGSSLPIRGSSRDTKGMKSETNNQSYMTVSSVSYLKSTKSNGDMILKVASHKQLDMDVDGAQELEMKVEPTNGTLPEIPSNVVAPKRSLHIKQHQIDPLPIPIDAVSSKPDIIEKQLLLSGSQERLSCAATSNTENEITSYKMDGFIDFKRMNKSMQNEAHNSSAAVAPKGLDSESSCTQTSLGLDVHNDIDMGPITRNVECNGNTLEGTLEVEGIPKSGGDQTLQEKTGKLIDGGGVINKYHSSVCQNSPTVKEEGDINPNRSELHDEDKPYSNTKFVQQSDHTSSETGGKTDVVDDNSSNKKENICTNKLQDPQDLSISELPEAMSSAKDLFELPDPQSSSGNGVKVVNKAHEDSILEEAHTIEVKHKRIDELSVRSLPMENQWKSHWDLVLEEMAWMANDFAQERLWKIAAASQICRRVAFDSRMRFEQQYHGQKLREKAHAMAKAVIQFWHLAELNLNGGDPKACFEKCERALISSTGVDKNDVSKRNSDRSNMEAGKEFECQHPRKNLALAVQDYAMRYLKYNSTLCCPLQAEAPATPNRISDFGIIENSWDDYLADLTEETLFYTVPSGAMEVYRKSIETHVMQSEKTGSSVQEEVETSYDAVAEDAYIEDEGGTSAYYLNGSRVSSKSSKLTHKKRKNLMKSYTSQSYEAGADLPYGHRNTATQLAMLIGKRSASHVGLIPTKRMRTASRLRHLGPFTAAAIGSVHSQMKTDASSGDTSSFQDDQSTLRGGSQFQKSMEVESDGDFNKQLPYDSSETSTKPKKKKKAKHLGSTYDKGWQLDSAILNEQRKNSRKRMDSHHFESSGTSGMYAQHGGKKPKILKQPFENICDNMTTVIGSSPSPVVSQNNMPNTNKILKLFGDRDRGRKERSSKNHVGEPGSGNPWSLFEDQALVVLVHDLGPNWELISDAINSTWHFKCIFRKSTGCKDRHKLLMDKSAGDGGDSAEDSGSSQPYPSTLPGIPKGSARQLFQRLQEPMEEDMLKSHFEKIIKIGQKQHYHRSQNENQHPKQIVQIHNSHIIALSQVCPNNLSGGVLTPLDLCDATTSSPDVLSLGYQGSHASDLAMSNQGLPCPEANSTLQGSSSMVLGGNLSSPSAAHNAIFRDGRYSVPRTSPGSVDEQQRVQQYNQMLSSRGIQLSTLPSGVSGTDRGVRVLPGGSGMGMICGMNRNMPISRPGFQGIASSPMLNSGSMLSSSMVGMTNPVNMHSGAGSSQGNSVIRPREALHMMRPGHNPEHHRQIMVPELQMQVTQGNSQGISPYNSMSAAFSSQMTPPAVQSYQGHPQQQHQVSPQQSHALGSPHHSHIQGSNHTSGSKQQAYAIRFAKERQLQQRYMQQQQQQQSAVSNDMMSHLQPQPHISMPLTLQNSSQIQPQTSSQPLSLSPLSPSSAMTPIPAQHQQKHHLPPHGLNRNPGSSGLTNQMAKQRQRQPHQQQLHQASRYHPQQRLHIQTQQQAKLIKGVGRDLVHQNPPMDHSHMNGLSVPAGSQPLEKDEQVKQLMQGQGLYSGSGLSQIQQSKLSISQSPSHSQLQQKLHTGPVPSKQCQFPSFSDHCPDGQVPTALSNHTTTHQAVSTTVMASNHQQVQPHSQLYQKQVNQTQPNAQRIPQENCQVNSELPDRSQSDVAQVDQHSLNSTSQVGVSMAVSQSSFDSANVLPVSPAVAAQWKSSEHACGSSTPNSTTQSSSVGSPPLSNSAGSETIPPISQGLSPMQLSGNLPSHERSVGTQWQQQELPPKHSLTRGSQFQRHLPHEQQPDHKSPPPHLSLQQ